MHHKLKTTFVFTFLLSVSSGLATQAASFDCSKAATETEKAICADKNLSSLDESMHEAYENYFATGEEIAPIPEIMAEWREVRDICGANSTCIDLVYREWIFALQQNGIIEQIAKPGLFAFEICMFADIDGDVSSPKVYSCFENIYNLGAPTATACHVGNNVYRITSSDKFLLEYWDSVVSFLRDSKPKKTTQIRSVTEYFGKDHFDLGCHIHSCISVAANTPDGNNLSSPGFYFFFPQEEWEPIFYPSETMFIFGSDNRSYPAVQFCRFLK